MEKKLFVIVVLIAVELMISSISGFTQSFSFKQTDNGKIIETWRGNSRIMSTPVSFPFNEHETNTDKSQSGIGSMLFNWNMKFSVPGKVFKDVSFANSMTGYIVTELGAVYKTTNGGDNWTIKLNLGFPYYWYGVDAISEDTIIISGFNNQGNINTGVVRWSFNGGTTWTNDIILRIPQGVGWTSRVHFFDRNKGIVMAEFSGGVHYTSTGGKDTLSWNYVQINSDQAWFAGNIDAQENGNVYTTGIHFAHSTDFGLSWITSNSADNVFDGGVDFLDYNNQKGWTGGGQISSPVSGWVHRTSDGGQSWSERLETFNYPIRAVKLFNDDYGLAIGGNVFEDAGGIHLTTNGGINWTLDVNTGAEMFSLDHKKISNDSLDIWCVGSTGGSSGFTGKLYKTRTAVITSIQHESQTPGIFSLSQNYPNPFNPNTVISYQLPVSAFVTLKIYDILGNEIETLIDKKQNAGNFNINFDGSNLSSGIYFYELMTNTGFLDTKRMVLLK